MHRIITKHRCRGLINETKQGQEGDQIRKHRKNSGQNTTKNVTQSLYHSVLDIYSPVLMSAGTAFFMHFSTEGRNKGDAARMESKTMTPKRDCKVQCLQFYYYHSGHESDQLNIWIREYQNEADSRGTLRLMDQITGLSFFYKVLYILQNI